MIKILLLDEDKDDSLLIKEMLKEGLNHQAETRHVLSVNEALPLLEKESFDIILLDLQLPDFKGLDSLLQLKRTSPCPAIIILSELNDEALAVQAVQIGAQDYLIKGQVNSQALARAIRYALERHRAQERVTYKANYDQLTGLTNRNLFHERLHSSLARCHRNDTAIALMFLDLDEFKSINDTFGHDYGDALLKTVGSRLMKYIRAVDTGVRMGGDEFAILLDQISSVEDVAAIAQRLLDLIAQPIMIHNHEIRVTSSLGITIYPWDCGNVQDLLKHSDTAMYRAKAKGGNKYEFYTAGMQAPTLDHSTMDLELRRALTKGEFLLHYQPQMDLHSEQIVGMEALIRWQHPYQGIVAPTNFIPKAEETGLIVPIGEWVVRTASLQAKTWERQGSSIPHIAVNLSAQQIHEKTLPASIEHILEVTQFDPKHLQLELTESVLIHETQSTIDTLHDLKSMGVQLFIDDFGIGYASLRYLKAFPVDGIKLDQSLIHDMTNNPHDAAIVRAIIALGNTLGLTVIAEGVETQEQAAFLKDHGCSAIQGYWVSPPLPAHESLQWASQG